MSNKYDVLVVGSGSAGGVVAARLSENPSRRVALVEAGVDYPDEGAVPHEVRYLNRAPRQFVQDRRSASTGEESVVQAALHTWRFTARATPDGDHMPLPRGQILGGSSAINGSTFVRGTRSDFAHWAGLGNPAWSFEQVLPFYRKLETDTDFHDEFHGGDGPIRVYRTPRAAWSERDRDFEAACLSLGYPACADHNHPDATGVGPIPRNSQDGTRMSVVRAYLDAARRRPNLSIHPSSPVHRIVFRGHRAAGVEVDRNGTPELIEADEIVLSAGAIGTPQLLMLSGVGSAEHLAEFGIPVLADLPGVGAGLHDHISLPLLWAGGAGFREELDSDSSPEGQLFLRFTSGIGGYENDCRITSPGLDRLSARFYMKAGLYQAESRGTVRLTSADPQAAPRIDLNYLFEQSDRDRMRLIVRTAIELSRSPILREALGPMIEPTTADLSDDASLDAWVKRRSWTAHHASSTARLGPASDPLAVVDQFGRLHGFEGIRVADASIMPNVVSQNTNNSAFMIGERIADFIERGH